MTALLNWAGNYAFQAPRLHRPNTVDEARRLVAGSRQVRAIGTRHSFNGIADTQGDLIDLGALDPGLAIDPDRQTVTVGAATTYGALAAYLHGQGWAIHNMASLPHISVAGAIATGTHGSGDRNGNLATAVAAIQLITADGELIDVRRGDEGFNGMVVGLGAFGIVTRLTLDIQPTFEMRQDAFIDLPWTMLLTNLDQIMSSAYSVSVMTGWSTPTVGCLWLKTRLDEGSPLELPAEYLGAHAVAAGPDDPSLSLNPFGLPGPWSERLPHFRADRDPGPTEQIQSEYMVPRGQAMTALARLRAIGDIIDPLLYASEIRTIAGDDLWLSPSNGYDTVAIHFTWKREPKAVGALSAEIEDMLIPLGARPHWGKLIHAPASRLAGLYPRMADFRELMTKHDPDGKFRNAFMAKHVFG